MILPAPARALWARHCCLAPCWRALAAEPPSSASDAQLSGAAHAASRCCLLAERGSATAARRSGSDRRRDRHASHSRSRHPRRAASAARASAAQRRHHYAARIGSAPTCQRPDRDCRATSTCIWAIARFQADQHRPTIATATASAPAARCAIAIRWCCCRAIRALQRRGRAVQHGQFQLLQQPGHGSAEQIVDDTRQGDHAATT